MGKHCRDKRGKRRSRWLSIGCVTEESERDAIEREEIERKRSNLHALDSLLVISPRYDVTKRAKILKFRKLIQSHLSPIVWVIRTITLKN